MLLIYFFTLIIKDSIKFVSIDKSLCNPYYQSYVKVFHSFGLSEADSLVDFKVKTHGENIS